MRLILCGPARRGILPDITAPATPTGLAAGTPTATTLPLTWDPHPNTDGDLAALRVYYTTDDTAVTTADAYVDFGAGSTGGTLPGLPSGTLIRAAIAARDASGNESALSAEVSGTTSASGATPFFETDFSDAAYVAGQTIVGVTDGELSWTLNEGGAPALISDNVGYGSSPKSLQIKYGVAGIYAAPYDSARYGGIRFNMGRNCPELWAEFYVYFADGTEGWGSQAFDLRLGSAGSSNKFINFWGQNSAEPNTVASSYNATYCGIQIWGNNASHPVTVDVHYPDFYPGVRTYPLVVTSGANQRGTWIRYRVHTKFSSAAGVADGEWDHRVNDALVERFSPGTTPITVDRADGFPTTHLHEYRFGMLGGSSQVLPAGTEMHYYFGLIRFYDQDPGWT